MQNCWWGPVSACPYITPSDLEWCARPGRRALLEEKINCLSSLGDKERNGLRAVITPLLEGCAGDGGKEQCCKVLCSALGMCSGIVVVNGIIPIARKGHSAVLRLLLERWRHLRLLRHPSLLSGSVILWVPSQQQISNVTPELRVWVCKTKQTNKNINAEMLRPCFCIVTCGNLLQLLLKTFSCLSRKHWERILTQKSQTEIHSSISMSPVLVGRDVSSPSYWCGDTLHLLNWLASHILGVPVWLRAAKLGKGDGTLSSCYIVSLHSVLQQKSQQTDKKSTGNNGYPQGGKNSACYWSSSMKKSTVKLLDTRCNRDQKYRNIPLRSAPWMLIKKS